jgi:hypothetical protein
MLLGWVTILLALSALNVYPVGGMVLATIFFSGFGFMLVAYIGYKRGEPFTLFAFGAIAVFVWSFSGFHILPAMGLTAATTANEVAAFMIVFALFIAVLAVITMKMPCRLLTITIFSAAILFLMVGIQAATGDANLLTMFGLWGMFVGILALYLGSAITLNTVYGRMVVPLMMKCEVIRKEA